MSAAAVPWQYIEINASLAWFDHDNRCNFNIDNGRHPCFFMAPVIASLRCGQRSGLGQSLA
jgi:hypothetical protein